MIYFLKRITGLIIVKKINHENYFYRIKTVKKIDTSKNLEVSKNYPLLLLQLGTTKSFEISKNYLLLLLQFYHRASHLIPLSSR